MIMASLYQVTEDSCRGHDVQRSYFMVEKNGDLKFFIELDFLTVVQALRRKKGEDLSYFGSLIADCYLLLRT